MRETGQRTSEAHALCSLGGVEGRLEQYEQAQAHLQEALTLYRQLGHRNGEATTLDNLGLGQPEAEQLRSELADELCGSRRGR